MNHPASALRPAINGCDPVFTTPTARNEHPQQWGSHFVLLELGSTLSTSFSSCHVFFFLALSAPASQMDKSHVTWQNQEVAKLVIMTDPDCSGNLLGDNRYLIEKGKMNHISTGSARDLLRQAAITTDRVKLVEYSRTP